MRRKKASGTVPIEPDAQESPLPENDFDSPMPRVSHDLERITESIYAVDYRATFERLQAELRVGEKRADYATLAKALDDAEDNARLAHALYLAAKLEREKWKLDMEVILAPMRTEATGELQKEKEQGLRSKQITDADVESKIAALHPEEVQWHASKATKLRGMEEHLLHLVELWKSRCRTLQTLVGALRR